jgi:hypothetical protein
MFAQKGPRKESAVIGSKACLESLQRTGPRPPEYSVSIDSTINHPQRQRFLRKSVLDGHRIDEEE